MTNPLDPMDLSDDVTNTDEVLKNLTPPDTVPVFGPATTSMTPPPVVVVQPVPPGRGKKNNDAVKPRTPLSQALPTAEKVKIERRRGDGHKVYIGHYAWNEIQRYGSMEVFLQQQVVPKFGAGEFELTYIRTDRSEEPRGIVIIDDHSTPQGQVAPLDQVVRLAKQLQDDATRNAPPPVDPLQQMQQLLAMQKQMSGDSNSMMPLVMMLMTQQRDAVPRVDPMESAMRLLEMTKSLAPPPMPLPMPTQTGPDPMLMLMLEQQKMAQQMAVEQMKMQAENTRMLVESMKQQDKGPSLSEVLHLSQSMQPKDQIGARDILPMISTMKELVRPPEKDGLREHLESFHLMQKALKEMSDDKPSGFREFAEGLLPEGVESITKLIQAVRSKETAAEQQLAGPMNANPAAQFPTGFTEYTNRLNLAKDKVEAMDAALRAFYFLANQDQKFGPAFATLVGHARGGDKDKALDLIESFLVTIGKIGLITENVANLALEGLDEHWDEVMVYILGGTTQTPPPSSASSTPPAKKQAPPRRTPPPQAQAPAQVIPMTTAPAPVEEKQPS